MKLIQNYLYNITYQLFILIIPLVTVPYISRVLGSEGVGINAYTNSIIQYFILFGSIGVNMYGNRTIAYYRDDQSKKSQLFWEIVILRFICIMISYLAFFAFLGFINKYQSFYFYQSFLLLAAAFDISWFFMGIEDFKKTVLRNILVKLISLIAIFLLVRSRQDIGTYILILSLSTLFGNLTLWPYLKKIISKPKWEKLNVIRHIKPSMTLFIPQVATQIYLVLNKTMLGLFKGMNDVGFYENTDKIVKITLAIVTATGTVMLPRVANTFAKGDFDKVRKYLYTSFDFVNSLSFPMAFGLAAIAPKFSIWFFGSDFSIVGKLLPILSMIIIFIGWSNVLGTQYLLPINQTKYFTFSVVTGAFVNLLFNLCLIPFFGIMGAVISTAISELAVALVQMFFVKESIKIEFLFGGIWKYLVSSVVMFMPVHFLNVNCPGRMGFFLIQILVGIIICIAGIFLLKASIINEITLYLKKKIN